MDAAERVAMFEDVFRVVGKEARLFRNTPGSPFPDFEAAVAGAKKHSLVQLKALANSSEGGRLAAKEYLAELGHTLKPQPSGAKRTAGDDKSKSQKRRAQRERAAAKNPKKPKKKKRVRFDTEKSASDSSSESDSDESDTDATPATKTAGGKLEPLSIAELKKLEIDTFLNKSVTGLTQVVQRVYLSDNPGCPPHKGCCGWLTCVNECKSANCGRCKSGAELSKKSAKAIKAQCKPELLARMPADSPFLKLAA